jgi:hypothetical protein
MVFFRSLYLIVLCCLGTISVCGQNQILDPTSWKYDLVQIDDLAYCEFTVNLDSGWHIWAMDPGGDGFQIAPSFEFDKAEGLNLVGSIVEEGTVVTAEMEGIDGAVRYFSNQVKYRQSIKIDQQLRRIAGRHIYQVCNDMMCLPPVEKEFVIQVAPDR